MTTMVAAIVAMTFMEATTTVTATTAAMISTAVATTTTVALDIKNHFQNLITLTY
jgi:hypothetical protein